MWLLDKFFPRFCVGCHQPGAYLCFTCRKTLLPHPELCPACHQLSKDFKTCPACMFSEKWYVDGLVVGFSYKNLLKKLILKLKFYHKKDIGLFMAERLALLVQTNGYLASALEKQELFISWVPSHRIRHYFQKGYNQSQVLAQQLAKILNITTLSLSKKKRATSSQVRLTREQRFKNLEKAFMVKNLASLPSESLILIVDDVTTTGATLNELAKTLKTQRPDLRVWWMVIARHN